MEIQRLAKFLEDAALEFSSLGTDLAGVSGRAMADALAAGERNPNLLGDMAKRRLRAKVPELTKALMGRCYLLQPLRVNVCTSN